MSGYDDPRWYEEQHDTPASPKQPASDDFEHYPFLPAADQALAQQPIQQVTQSPPPDRLERARGIVRQVLITVVLVVIAFFAGWFGHEYFTTHFFNQSDASKSYQQLFDQAWATVDQNYVDRKNINYKNMSYAAIQAMIGTLQDTGHSRFMDPATVQNENQQLKGTFPGIGIFLSQDPTTKKLIIASTIPHAPAEKAGLKAGDVITAVNGTSLAGKDINATSQLIQGPVNTPVTLTIQRAGSDKTQDIKVIRAEINAPNVYSHYIAETHTVDIQISQFSDGTTNQVKDAVNQAKSQGATKIILDLRNNPGGYLTEAVNTASLFLKSGNVLLEEDSTGQKTPIAVNGNPIDTTDPIVVLVNSNTASAAEIVSGALQDNKRATVIGEKTFGTGTVLQQFQLTDGSVVLLGTQEWLTPNGNFIRSTPTKPGGITPDQVVKQDQNTPILSPNDANQRNLSEQQILASGDAPLAAALHFLAGQK